MRSAHRFQAISSDRFCKWKGDAAAPVVAELFDAITERATGEAQPHRPAIASKTPLADVLHNRRALVSICAFALVAVFAGVFLIGSGSEDGTPRQIAAGIEDASDGASIAVMPFRDMSPEGNQEYFADGLSEELLNVLVRVDGLRVASRTSSFALKEEIVSTSDIAERLGVNHVLEGSVRKMNSRVRITAQLVDARTDKHLWSETYDRHLSDIFRIQDEIATAVVSSFRDKLGIEEDEEIKIKPATENLTAYDAYLKARELYVARGKANVHESMKLFEHVVDIDPNFARGWEGLAGVYAIATSWGILDRDYSALSLVAANKALELDPDLSRPYAVIGLTYRTHYPTPWSESIDNLKKAIERDAKVVDARLWLGMNYLAVGEMRDAIEVFDSCLELDPNSKLCRKYRSMANLALNDFDTALIDANANAEDGYYRDFDAYLPYFLDRGERLLAFTISRTVNWWGGSRTANSLQQFKIPKIPLRSGWKSLKRGARQKNIDVASHTNLMLTLRAYDEVTVGTFDNDYEHLWLPQFSRLSPLAGIQTAGRRFGPHRLLALGGISAAMQSAWRIGF